VKALVSSKLKKKFENVVEGFVILLANLGFTPNTLTVMGLLTSTVSASVYLHWQSNRLNLVYAAILILVSGFIDAIDGALARKTGNVTSFGGFFDSIADRYSDALIISAVVISGLSNPIWGIAALIGSLMVSYTRSRSEAAGVSMLAVGLAERAERMMLLVVITFVAYFRIEILNYGIVVLAIISNLTVFQRILYFLNEVKKRD
jgi:archaetidylinositol phosphate synthase